MKSHLKLGELDERLRSAWGRDGDIGRHSEEEPSIADIQAALHGHSSQKERVQKGFIQESFLFLSYDGRLLSSGAAELASFFQEGNGKL